MGKLYCLFNPEYNACKIGYTVYDNIINRVKQITYQNAKNYAWQCLFYIETDDASLETKVHRAISSLGYATIRKLGSEYYDISIDEAYCFLRAIAQMYHLRLQPCKIKYKGREIDEGLSELEQLLYFDVCRSEYLKTQLCAPRGMPKGYWNAQDYIL